MKKEEIKNLSVVDLQNKLTELKSEYNKMRLAHKISAVENPMQIKNMRKTIARLNTELSAKQQ